MQRNSLLTLDAMKKIILSLAFFCIVAFRGKQNINQFMASEGSAARFFYCAKASKADRDEGLDGFAVATASEMTGGRKEGSAGLNNPRAGAGRTAQASTSRHNAHLS